MTYYVAYLTYQTENYRVIGWTDNEYIMKEFIKLDYWRSYGVDVMMYECPSEKDFVEGVLEYYDVNKSDVALFKLKLIPIGDNNEKSFIMSDAEIENICYDTDCICEYLKDALNSIVALSYISKYIKDDNVKTFIDYLRVNYFKKLYKKYSQDFVPVPYLIKNIINAHHIIYDCLYGESDTKHDKP